MTVPGGISSIRRQFGPFAILPIVVSNANDAGPGSLRQAIVNANSNAGVIDIVTFSVQGTIALLSPLPAIVEPATLNGLKTGECGQSGAPWRFTAATSRPDPLQASS